MSTEGEKSRRFWRVIFLGILLVIYVALTSCVSSSVGAAPDSSAPETGPITVKITNTNPEVKTAIARVVETNETDSLDQNKLSLSSCLSGQRISIWAPGYYIFTFTCNGTSPVEYPIALEALNAVDNPNYAWIDADARFNSILHCSRCHSGQSPSLNEYSEWLLDGHSRSLASHYFWSTYMGSDLYGSPGQTTRWGISQDGSRIRLPPDPMQPDYGPGYQLDYPNESGNCAFCHAPAAVGATQQGVNLNPLISSSFGNRVNVATEGVTCDVCHKVIGVSLDKQGLPFVERPGILSFSLVRPAGGFQFIAGPWSHLANSTSDFKRTCAPVFSESEFCAPCHYGKFSGVEIYASYKEWLDSPYSQPDQNFRSCQDCHMASPEPIGSTVPSQRGACSESNLTFRDFSHNMMDYGPEDPNNPLSRTIPRMVKKAGTVTIEQIVLAEGQVTFTVKVLNTGAGHKFPTDSPLRHLILLVEVRDANGTPLTQVSGPVIPRVGDVEFAGYPGEIYANLLKDRDTSTIPTIAYWNPVEPAWQGSDTRLVPAVPRYSTYSFARPVSGSFEITARLIYRNAFSDIADNKLWTPTDIEAAAVTVPIVP